MTRSLRRSVVLVALASLLTASTASAATTRVIVRVNAGLPLIKTICAVLGCTVNYGLGDPDGQLFLVTTPSLLPNVFLSSLRLSVGVLSAEIDVTGHAQSGATAQNPPAALYDRTPVNYYGSPVWRGRWLG